MLFTLLTLLLFNVCLDASCFNFRFVPNNIVQGMKVLPALDAKMDITCFAQKNIGLLSCL